MNIIRFSCLGLALLGSWPGVVGGADAPIVLPVAKLAAPPMVDGQLEEWNKEGWVTVPIRSAIPDDNQNLTGPIEVRLAAGVFGDRFYLAADWPDPEADTLYKPWKWEKSQYKRGKNRDDMFAIRFQIGDSYDECMFTKKDYRVDVWQWSAGRSDLAGLAEDAMHILSTAPVENAAEYEMPGGGMVYIQKPRDAGEPFYENAQPDTKTKQADELPGIVQTGKGSGSLVDVTAKGVWSNGRWRVEFSRSMNTGHPDDRAFAPGDRIPSGIAVFNKGASEHKSVSNLLAVDFSALR